MGSINENPQQAAQRFSARMLKQGFVFQALHEYCDAEGKAIYWRIRLKHPQTGEKWLRPMHCNGAGKFVLSEPPSIISKPLYRLPEIICNRDKMVWITEGEWCADALAKMGLVTTTSGGADSANKTDWTPLAERNVIIWRDYDEAGLRYAIAVTFLLHQFGCTVQWVNVEKINLAEKEDCVDWLNNPIGATASDIEALPLLSTAAVTEIVNSSLEIPAKTKRATSNLYSFMVNEKGVFYTGENDSKWICSSLEIKALVRDKLSENWGRLLEFTDADGNLHTWAMPMEMLKGGEELRGELLRLGLEIAPGIKPRNLLIEYHYC